MATQRKLTTNHYSFKCVLRHPIAWLLLALLTVGNPLACLLHCWSHDHASVAVPTSAMTHAAHQTHGGASQPISRHVAAALPIESTTQRIATTVSTASGEATCHPISHVPSVVTIAVLFGLLLVIVPFRPAMPVVSRPALLRLLSIPPPHQPPRFASFFV